MKLESNENFDRLVESFKKLDNKTQRRICINEFKDIIITLDKLGKLYKHDSTVLFNREILDTNNDVYTDSDFFESTFVYIKTIEDLLGQYMNKHN